jgi:hypothetical protein
MDANIRALERAAQADDLEARAALLAARARAGRLDPDRLRLAAWLGDDAARLALGDGAPEAPRRRTKRDPWTRELAGWGHEALVRAGLVVTADELRHWRRHHRDDLVVPGIVAAVEAWTREPSAEAVQRVAAELEREAPRPRDDRASRALARVARLASIVLAAELAVALPHALQTLGESPPTPVRAAIREVLVPWALA